MGFEGADFDAVEGLSPGFVDKMFERWLSDRGSVDPSWASWFEGLERSASGPSWRKPDWPPQDNDPLVAAMDPTQATPDPVKASAKAEPPLLPTAPRPASPPSTEAIHHAADDSIRAMMLIRTYRVRGHLAADLDPLGLYKRKLPADLTPEYHGFSGEDLDRPIYLGGAMGLDQATVREIVEILQRNYCGHVGIEYMHIGDVEERRFLQSRMEGSDKAISFTPEGKKAILAKVIQAEQWEKFCGRKYVGTKRFGLDGGESMIPALESVIKYGGQFGVREIVFGMAHRGRLNVLSNVMAKPYRVIFHEFSGGSANPEDVGGSGDVKYHLGTSTDREFDGIKVHLSLAPNPSHLEAVDPVVLGKARAVQTIRDDREREKVMPILLHGDAAFAGQGIVMECFGFSGLVGYNTGGTIHFIINNQVGFTTSPQFGRSSPYPSDVAKGIQAPILHVNGDDPEAVTFACKVATEFRHTFKRDVVIDMWCYRRFGHNEGDEPSFTQPLMYAAIAKHPPVSEIYGKRLIEEGVVDQAWIDSRAKEFTDLLEGEFEAGKSYLPNKADWFEGRWAGFSKPEQPETGRRNTETGIEPKLFESLGRTLTTVPGRSDDPQDAAAHPRCQDGDVRQRRGLRLGDRRGAGLRHARPRGLPGPPVGPGQRPRHVQPAPFGLGRSARRPQIYPVDAHRRRRPLRGARQPAFRVRRAWLRIRLCDGRSKNPRVVGSAVRRFRQWRAGDDRSVHCLGRSQVAARVRSRDAAAAWL